MFEGEKRTVWELSNQAKVAMPSPPEMEIAFCVLEWSIGSEKEIAMIHSPLCHGIETQHVRVRPQAEEV